MSFTCTSLSPVTVRFVAVKDSPKFDEPCDNDSSSISSGSSTGTLYFGSPAELPYVSAFIKKEILFINILSDQMSSPDIFTFCRHYPSYSKHSLSPLQRQTGYC